MRVFLHRLQGLIVAALCCVPVVVQSATCYQWNGANPASWKNSKEEACADSWAEYQEPYAPGRFTMVSIEVLHVAVPLQWGCLVTAEDANLGGLEGTYQIGIGHREDAAGCPDEECPAAGEKISATYPTGTAPGTAMCSPRGGGCVAIVGKEGAQIFFRDGLRTVGTVEYTGTTCTYSPGPTSGNDSSAISQGGDVGEVKDGCASVNGDKVCPSDDDDGCHFFPSGGYVCVADSPTATPPDNGTPGEEAEPDATVQGNNGTGSRPTYNYYGPTTVINSSTPVEGGAASGGPGDPCVGAACPEEEGEGDESASGGGDCAAPPSCDGDAIDCALLSQQWLLRCPGDISEEQITAAVGEGAEIEEEEIDVTDVLDEGILGSASATCPTAPTITVFGESLELPWITYICDLMALLAPVVMVCAYVTAGHILLGGVTR